MRNSILLIGIFLCSINLAQSQRLFGVSSPARMVNLSLEPTYWPWAPRSELFLITMVDMN
jgi:hypothetical protein